MSLAAERIHRVQIKCYGHSVTGSFIIHMTTNSWIELKKILKKMHNCFHKNINIDNENK